MSSTGSHTDMRLPLRPYQERIVASVLGANTVVLLPTGTGKTLIAVEAIARRSQPAVLFVPTIPLVSQQAAAIRSQSPAARVDEYHGELSVPTDFDVLVTTPKAFETAQGRGVSAFQWSQFGTVVFDEVHHVIRDHPYRNLALKLRRSPAFADTRVIGLTASLTYAIGAAKINKTVQQLCTELGIEKIEHADDDELRAGGYKGAGRGAVAELRLSDTDVPGVVPIDARKPHLMHQTFFGRVRRGDATQFSLELVRTVSALEQAAHEHDPQFRSPLTSSSLKTWGVYAHSRTAVSPVYTVLEHWYEALRLIVTSWEEREDAALLWLRMAPPSSYVDVPAHVKKAVALYFEGKPTVFGKVERLFEVLMEKSASPDFRGIVFVQQRIMTHILQHAVEGNPDVSGAVRAQCLYATGTPATPSYSLSKAAAADALHSFRSGKVNLLIATNVAEEGLDIPAANCVIYFDPMHTAVSYVQGRGRARQADSSFVMLDERADRPASLLAEQELEQHAVASTFKPVTSADGLAHDTATHLSRRRNAQPVLDNATAVTAIAALNTYCKKTKVVLDEHRVQKGGAWEVNMTYTSPLVTVAALGVGPVVKVARAHAAFRLIESLRALPAVVTTQTS